MSACERCELYEYHCKVLEQEQYHRKLTRLASGSHDGRFAILILSASPGQGEYIDYLTEVKSVLKEDSRKLDLTEYPVYYFSAISCNYPDNAKIKATWVKECSVHVKRVIKKLVKKHDNLVIVAAGAESLLSLSVIERKKKRKKRLKSSVVDAETKNLSLSVTVKEDGVKRKVFCKVFASENMARAANNPSVRVFAHDALLKVQEYVEDGGVEKTYADDYHRVIVRKTETIEKIKKRLKHQIRTNGSVIASYDIETNDKLQGYHEDSRITTFAIAFRFKGVIKSYCMALDHFESITKIRQEVEDFLRWFMKSPDIIKVTHNGAFDMGFTSFCIPGVKIESWRYDTMTLASYCGMPKGRRGLKFLASKFCSIHEYTEKMAEDEAGKVSYTNTPLDDLGIYNCNDAIATLSLLEKLREYIRTDLKKRGVDIEIFWDFFNKRISVMQNTLLKMQVTGIPVSNKRRKRYCKIFRTKIAELEERLHNHPDVLEYEKTFLNEKYFLWKATVDDPEDEKAWEKWMDWADDEKSKKNRDKRSVKDPEYNRFNPNSTKQMIPFAIDHLKMPVLKKTATGRVSCDKEVLSKWALQKSVFLLLQNVKKAQKEYSTYLKGLVDFMSIDRKRVHAKFNLGHTETGRLSSSDPNLQNQKSRGHSFPEYKVKNIYKAPKGFIIVAFDYSQAELRVLASVSEDAAMINTFLEGIDIHQKTGALLFNVAIDVVTKLQRHTGKTTNFGIVYRMGFAALAEKFCEALLEKNNDEYPQEDEEFVMQKTTEEAESILASLKAKVTIPKRELKEPFKKSCDPVFYELSQYVLKSHRQEFPQVWDWIERTEKFAIKHGFVQAPTGRVCFVPDIHSRNRGKAGESKRLAVNAPIQGTSSDLTVSAMNRVQDWIEEEELQDDVQMINQVHDAVYYLMRLDNHFSERVHHIKTLMEDTSAFSFMRVPFAVDLEVGPSWGELEEVRDFSELDKYLDITE